MGQIWDFLFFSPAKSAPHRKSALPSHRLWLAGTCQSHGDTSSENLGTEKLPHLLCMASNYFFLFFFFV